MNTLDAIRHRRSFKAFDTTHRMTDTEQRTLLETVLLSPTAFNLQHWRLVLVENPALRQQIRAAGWDQPQITEASLLVVLCAANIRLCAAMPQLRMASSRWVCGLSR